jgi:hypothetical protein
VTYLTLCFFLGLAGGFTGTIKGSSFWLWFAVSAILPVLGLVAALLYRVDRDEPRRRCPTCGKVVKLHDAICTRCGTELEYTDDVLAPEAGARTSAR